MLLTAYKINVNDNFPPAATVPNSEMMLAGICNPTKKTKEQHKTLERIYPTNNALFFICSSPEVGFATWEIPVSVDGWLLRTAPLSDGPGWRLSCALTECLVDIVREFQTCRTLSTGKKNCTQNALLAVSNRTKLAQTVAITLNIARVHSAPPQNGPIPIL